jgi:hypothetical protein
MIENWEYKYTNSYYALDLESWELKTHFETAFVDKNNQFADFESYLLNCADRWMMGAIDLPFGFLCQSHGYGSSRITYEFAKKHITIYACFAHLKKLCCPSRSRIADQIFTTLNRSIDEIQDLIVAMVDRALDQVEMIKWRIHGEHLTESSIAAQFAQLQPWTKSTNNQTDYNIDAHAPDLETRISQLKVRFEQVMSIEKSINIPLIIALDESKILIKSWNKNGNSYFKMLANAACKTLPGMKVSFLLISTDAEFFHPFVRNNRITQSQVSRPIYPPYCRLMTVDFLGKSSYMKILKDFSDQYTLCQVATDQIEASGTEIMRRKTARGIYAFMNDLTKTDRLEGLFSLGRPIWATRSRLRESSMIAKNYLLIKNDERQERFSGGIVLNVEDTFELFTLAVIATRTNLLANHHVLSYTRSRKLVADHAATLYDINEARDKLKLCYVSEPVVAEAVASLMCNHNSMTSILRTLSETLASPSSTRGPAPINQLVCQLILLIAKDRAAVTKYGTDENLENILHSLPITVDAFLIALFGQSNYKKHIMKRLDNQIRQGIVSFSHFIQKNNALRKMDLFVEFLGRNAAGIFKDGFPFYDLFIPVVCVEDEIGMLLFKVNYMERFDLDLDLKVCITIIKTI